MWLDDRSLRILEFDKVRQMLAAQATWALGKEKALSLEVFDRPDEVRGAQEETQEAKVFVESHPGWRMGGLRDVRSHVLRASTGAILEPAELLDVAATVTAARRAKGYLCEHAKAGGDLRRLALSISPFEGMAEEISRCISQEGNVKDEASPGLTRIRSSIRSLSTRLKERLEGMVRSPELARYLQDPIITIREGRYVVPVKQEHRGSVPGIIHDQSSSGATVFVEPEACVALNNELRRLELDEDMEVRRVLRALSALVSEAKPQWEQALEALGSLDLALAKAHLALEMNAIRPALSERALVNLIGCRHPLLGEAAIPIDIRVGDEFDILVITGPNTGGKTVSLKTVGLMCLLHQSGLQIPARDGSTLGVFTKVHCDIGDEQSIEQSLSTFSSHMGNIARFVSMAGPGTLILMDEMGAGTDPVEGSSLAMAVMDRLAESGARVVATTHYSELKSFAFQKQNVENAAMEFDPESLRPTFRLIMGLPGRSNAFEISERLGLPREIVDRARSYLEGRQTRADSLIRQIEEDSLRLEADRERIHLAVRETQVAREEAERELERIKCERDTVLAKAREEAASLVRRAAREVREALKTARRSQKAYLPKETEEAYDRLRALRSEVEVPSEPEPGEPPEDLVPGDVVLLPGAGVRATVLSSPQEGQVMVQAGAVRVRVPLSDVREASHLEAEVMRERVGSLAASKAERFSPELDLRGLTVEDALMKTDKYLDDAGLAGIKRVRVIHGKGTGALKRAIADYLKGHSLVSSFREGGPGEGGEGVTFVDIC